jgi:hypothetical protein
MPATTTRKRQTERTENKRVTPDRAKPAAEAVPPVDPSQAGSEQDPAAALRTAYGDAMEARDAATGVIPAVAVDAVRVAYGQVPKRQRPGLVAKLAGEAGQHVTGEDGSVDTGLAVAVATLSGLFAKLNEEERPTPPPHDPVPGVAGIVAALDQLREEILGGLSDDQRVRVGQVDTASDPAAQASSQATLAAVGKIKDRALSGRSRRNGTRAPATRATEAIQEAVRKSSEPVTFDAIANDHGVSASTLWSRWTADNTPGVKAVEDASGRKAFAAV